MFQEQRNKTPRHIDAPKHTVAAPWGIGFAPYYTFCDNSDPTLSLLWVVNQNFWNPATQGPPANFALPFGAQVYDFNFGIDYAPSTTIGDCIGFNPYGSPPSWRQSEQANINNTDPFILAEKEIKISPNPTTGLIEFIGTMISELHVDILNSAGNIQLREVVSNADRTIDLALLPPGLYIVQISMPDGKLSRSKIIKLN